MVETQPISHAIIFAPPDLHQICPDFPPDNGVSEKFHHQICQPPRSVSFACPKLGARLGTAMAAMATFGKIYEPNLSHYHMGVNPKIGGKTPQIIHFNRVWFSIIFTIHFGVPFFLVQHPYGDDFFSQIFLKTFQFQYLPSLKLTFSPLKIGRNPIGK